VFAPVYYDQPETQIVLGLDIAADDHLTAAVTAGAPYFKISAIDVCDWVFDEIDTGVGELPVGLHRPPVPPHPLQPPTRHLSDPVAKSDEKAALAVKKGQYARVWVTLDVPKGSDLKPGNFAGTATLSGTFGKKSASLTGTYLGPLIGEVRVTPTAAAPGQAVLVEVCDANGKPVTDPTINVVIQGVPAASRYLQYAAPGRRTLAIRAIRGSSSETAQATIDIEGQPMAFRETLGTPTVNSLPMISAARVHGQPYAATLRLGNTNGARRVLAETIAKTAASKPPTPLAATRATAVASPAVPLSATPSLSLDILGTAVRDGLKALPAAEVKTFAPVATKTAKGTVTASAAVGAIKNLPVPAAVATTYRWDFGDGTTATTESAVVTHDFFRRFVQGGLPTVSPLLARQCTTISRSSAQLRCIRLTKFAEAQG
jgi:hypothetical protein